MNFSITVAAKLETYFQVSLEMYNEVPVDSWKEKPLHINIQTSYEGKMVALWWSSKTTTTQW
jgi:hypothetical protein